MRNLFLLFFILFFSINLYALEVAITVDDLPVHGKLPAGMTRSDVAKQMLAALDKHNMKNVYGFINGDELGNDPDHFNVLSMWVNDGQLLGNHTYTHINLETNTPQDFIHEIQLNEPILNKLMGNKNYRYFRYPYLYEGETEAKRNTVRNYLFAQHYQVAQITLDFADYLWNAPYARCKNKNDVQAIAWLKKSYLEHAIATLKVAHELSMLEFKRDIKNILLLHIGPFDALMLDDLITNFEKQGVTFISLDDALSDSAYHVNPNIAKSNTWTFLAQMRIAKHIAPPADFVTMEKSLPVKELKNLCRS